MSQPTQVPTIVLGGSGYVAGEFLRLIAGHPELALGGVVSTSQAGEAVGMFSRLRDGLSRSRQALTAELGASIRDRMDEATWEELEEALILADVGAPTTAAVVRRLEDEVGAGKVSGADGVRERLVELVSNISILF